MKKKNFLKAGILLTILMLLTLVLPVSTVSAQQTVPTFNIVVRPGPGVGIRADVTYLAGPDLNMIPCTITATGGLIFSGNTFTYTISQIKATETVSIKAFFWGFANPFGLGIIPSATFTVTVGADTATAPQHKLFIIFTY
jgi:uncharacterized integral membrane protein